MPDTDGAWRLLQQQALDLRDRAEQFRTALAATKSRPAREALTVLANTADRLAAEIEAQIGAPKTT